MRWDSYGHCVLSGVSHEIVARAGSRLVETSGHSDASQVSGSIIGSVTLVCSALEERADENCGEKACNARYELYTPAVQNHMSSMGFGNAQDGPNFRDLDNLRCFTMFIT